MDAGLDDESITNAELYRQGLNTNGEPFDKFYKIWNTYQRHSDKNVHFVKEKKI